MTSTKFRQLALSLPDVVEASHMNHPDFRVGGKIFASLSEDSSWGMVKLSPVQQAEVVAGNPDMFVIFDNAWGKQGCTKVILKPAKVQPVMEALKLAWETRQKK
jgi:hypothetical protein